MDIGEFEFIERIKEHFPARDGEVGIGDDCAVLPQQSGFDTLVSTDLLVEGVHFLREDASPEQLGWKSAAVNFSDIAAMGGQLTGSFLSIAIPHNLPTEWAEGFIRGYHEISQHYGAPLLGGDTTRSLDKICINVGVLGRIECGKARLRSHAQPGDLICVTGTLGDSGAGLQIILNGIDRNSDAKSLVHKHYHPMPRIFEGQCLANEEGVHAMMDISDGIGSDLRHILHASHVGAEIDTAAIPLSEPLKNLCGKQGWDALDFAINGGEDYELLFTMAPDTRPTIPYHVIGRITDTTELLWLNDSGQQHTGFRHF